MSARTLDAYLSFESSQLAERVAQALAVETREHPPRTRAALDVAGDTVHLRLEADDTRGLRAATNSFLRWADTAAEVARAAARASESFKGAG